jgi:thymidylate kinase
VKDKQVTITVSGKTGTGKSAVLQLIRDMLENRGIDIADVQGFDPQTDERSDHELEIAVSNLVRSDLEVVLVEHQAGRK